MKNTMIMESERARVSETAARELFSTGVLLHLNGYLYLREAITEIICNGDETFGITKNLYPHVASVFSSSPAAVERAIRTAIRYVCKRKDTEKLRHISNKDQGEKLHFTNKEFILTMANQVRKVLIDGIDE